MLLVVFALQAEARIFERRLAQKTKRETFLEGTICGARVAVCFVGIRASALASFEETIQKLRPSLVINSGFAGATRTLLEPGDFLLASNYTTAQLELPIGSVIDARGTFRSVDQVTGPTEKKKLGSTNVAVDMESESIAAVCDRHGIPLVTARMISDGQDEVIPAVFIGGKLRSPNDMIAAGHFALRMLRLTRLLADRLTRLIRFAIRSDHRPSDWTVR
jgi:nucleoside phosphorylase